jgi:hypothetical protein
MVSLQRLQPTLILLLLLGVTFISTTKATDLETSNLFLGHGNDRSNRCSNQVVTEADVRRLPSSAAPGSRDNWVLFTGAAGIGAFMTGPATPPSGKGSLILATGNQDADYASLLNYEQKGTRLGQIDKLNYYTYRHPDSPSGPTYRQVPYLFMEVDLDSTTSGVQYADLTFEPFYTYAIVDGTWQYWDALTNTGNRLWWSHYPVLSRCINNIPPIAPLDCFFYWSEFIAEHPNAVISGGFGVGLGTYNRGTVGNADKLTIGTRGNRGRCTTFDFEPFRSSSSHR